MAILDMSDKEGSLADLLSTLRQFTQPKVAEPKAAYSPPSDTAKASSAAPISWGSNVGKESAAKDNAARDNVGNNVVSRVAADTNKNASTNTFTNTFTNTVANKTVTPPAVRSRPVSGADRANHEAARMLLERINSVTGFRSSPSLEAKLALVLRNVSAEEVETLLKQQGSNASADLSAIVEDLTNHETFFFRDTMQLDPLADEFLPQLIQYRARKDKRLRIWSAACATGEEPYTLAILALNALCAEGYARFSETEGFILSPEWQLEILGTDISRQAVRVARAGSYLESGFGSFRQMPGGWQRYFSKVSAGAGRYGEPASYLSVLPSISRFVRFDTFNLMSRNPPMLDCDLVLCRNVLIYIDIHRHVDVYDMISRGMRSEAIFVPSLVDQVVLPGFKTRWANRCAFYEKR